MYLEFALYNLWHHHFQYNTSYFSRFTYILKLLHMGVISGQFYRFSRLCSCKKWTDLNSYASCETVRCRCRTSGCCTAPDPVTISAWMGSEKSFSYKYRARSCEQLASDGGIVPLKWFPRSLRIWSCPRFPTASERYPRNSAPCRWIADTRDC